MDITLLGARLVLAAVFVVAAAGKLRDRGGFRRTLGDFGVPGRAVGVLSVVVPAAELATAALLVPIISAGWGAASSLVLLGWFTTAVAVNLAKGRTPDCRCFGQVGSAPIGLSTLARNAVLAFLAALLLFRGPGADLNEAMKMWAADTTPGERLAWLGAVVLVAGLGALARHFREQTLQLRRRLETLERQVTNASATPSWTDRASASGLRLGAPAPPFDLPLLAGDRATLESLTAARTPVLLIFSSSHCPSCAELWPDIGRWQRDHAAVLKVAVLSGGSAQAIEMKLVGTDVQDVLLADDSTLLDAYRVPGIPAALILDPNGMVASETVMGPAAVRELVRVWTTRSRPSS